MRRAWNPPRKNNYPMKANTQKKKKIRIITSTFLNVFRAADCRTLQHYYSVSVRRMVSKNVCLYRKKDKLN